jgi:AmmeMemoRadiSam system protein A
MSKNKVTNLTAEDRALLLKLARQSIEAVSKGKKTPQPELEGLSLALIEPSACFITLYKNKQLRGCTGTLVAKEPLAHAVSRIAAQTALSDPRFPIVTPDEVPLLDIEISILTPPQPLEFSEPADLPGLLRPGIDGVTLSYDNLYRATFLPQVWERITDPSTFLDMLSQKMGLGRKAWLMPGIQVETYQVENFSEKGHEEP